jgi:hypothetical protein
MKGFSVSFCPISIEMKPKSNALANQQDRNVEIKSMLLACNINAIKVQKQCFYHAKT